MKRILAITVTMALLLSVVLVTPALAENNGEVEVGLRVDPGEGQAPIIKVKWETPDHDLEIAGTQINPPLVYGAYVAVQYWAIVTHPVTLDAVAGVELDVFYPNIAGAGDEWCGVKKYERSLVKQEKFGPGGAIEAFEEAWENGTISDECINWDYFVDMTRDEVLANIRTQLSQCDSEVWMVEDYLHYHQPAGMYRVVIKAASTGGQVSSLTNYMEYVAVSAVEIDFSTIDYGIVPPCSWVNFGGDTIWGSPKPTVRNIGNTDSRITVHQTDLYDEDGVALGLHDGAPAVEYRARLGGAEDNIWTVYDPCEEVTLDRILPLCSTDKLDFGVHIKKLTIGHGEWTGDMTIGSVAVDFDDC